ncbi:MAG: sulfite exporter TauE/SafE family protein [Bacteroidetes bacterium]|nr:sulfite exporter TauE/SafE family protein [Bacteroidota bacterium]
MLLLTAILLGLASSLHCVGMCGPIVMSIPFLHFKKNKYFAMAIYHTGRLFVYALLGIFSGSVGALMSLVGFEQWMSIIAGAFLVLIFFIPKIKNAMEKKLASPVNKIQTSLGKYLFQPTYSSVTLMGMLNGILPCGMVYAALVAATAAGSTGESMLYMVFFGVGTLPLLLACTIGFSALGTQFKNQFRKWAPYGTLVIGLLFILRGLNLGVPYVSPHFEEKTKTMNCCHVKNTADANPH